MFLSPLCLQNFRVASSVSFVRKPVSLTALHLPLSLVTRHRIQHSNTARSRRIRILFQIEQQFTEALLTGSARAALGSFPRDIDELGNAFPAGTARSGVVPVGEELLGFGASLGTALVCLVAVRNVEIVDVLLRLLDCCGLLLSGNLSAAGKVGISSFAPFTVKR